jgi:hypothetical protein
MEYKRHRVQFGWLDLKKEGTARRFGSCVTGKLWRTAQTRAKSNRWINRKISNRVKGTHGKHVLIAFN